MYLITNEQCGTDNSIIIHLKTLKGAINRLITCSFPPSGNLKVYKIPEGQFYNKYKWELKAEINKNEIIL